MQTALRSPERVLRSVPAIRAEAAPTASRPKARRRQIEEPPNVPETAATSDTDRTAGKPRAARLRTIASAGPTRRSERPPQKAPDAIDCSRWLRDSRSPAAETRPR